MSDGYTVAFCCSILKKPVSISLEFVLFASFWRDDCCWWLIKVTFAALVLFSNVGLGELGSRSLLLVIGWTYHFGALFWLYSSFIAVSKLPGLRLVVFLSCKRQQPGRE